MDLAKFILPTELGNTDEKQNRGNKEFQAKDLLI